MYVVTFTAKGTLIKSFETSQKPWITTTPEMMTVDVLKSVCTGGP